MSYRIETAENPADGVRRIAREQLARALAETAHLGGPEEASAVHGLRKRVKKIRALLRLVQREIGGEIFREENARLREVAHTCSDLRDARVQLQLLEKLRAEAELAPTALARFARLLREDLKQAAGQFPPPAETIAALTALYDRLEGWPIDELTAAALAAAFARTYRQARRCFHHVLEQRTPEIFHAWRKRTKNVWYQARLLQQLNPVVLCQISDAAASLGGHLGDLHDLAFLRAKLERSELAPARERDLLRGLVEVRVPALEEIALDLGRRFYAEKPGAFKRRLRRYADAWPASSS